MELYRWNLEVAGGLHESLALVEVVLRNAMDQQLQAWNASQKPRTIGGSLVHYSTDWVQTPAAPLWGILNPKRRGVQHSTYKSAADRAAKDSNGRDPSHPRAGAAVCHDDVVAHITFGTWNNLLPHKRKQDGTIDPPAQRIIWDQALIHAFPYHADPLVVRYWVDRLHRLRNRVAHLEPLISTHVMSYHRTAARLLHAVDPDVASWYAGISRVPGLLRRRP